MLTLERINDYLTSDEATQLLRCSKRTLRRYVSQGLLSKTGVGKNTRYSAESVMYLVGTKGKSKIDRVLTQLASVAHTQQLILARLALIESVFFESSPKITLNPAEVGDLKLAVRKSMQEPIIEFSVCEDWSVDLLRLSADSLQAIGSSLLSPFLERLILAAEGSKEISKSPSKRVVVDRLRWVNSSVGSKHQA